MIAAQLDLFTEPRVMQKSIYYKDLNIHQRINVKANSLIFAHVFILQLRRGFDHCSIITRYEHPEGLQWELLREHRELNPKSYQTIYWREQERDKKQELKFKK